MNKWEEAKHIICLTLICNVVARCCLPFSIIVSLGWQAFMVTMFFRYVFRYLPPECFDLSKTPFISSKVMISGNHLFTISLQGLDSFMNLKAPGTVKLKQP
jgi:hypothetical protein